MTGPIFEADTRRVNQVINSNVQGEATEQWIDPHKRKQNGWVYMGTLGDHYYGEGNASRCIGKSERIRNSIHYKNERSMSFSVFLGKLQKIINIFTDQKDPHYEEMKVRFLFNIVQHTALSAAI